MIVPGPRLSVFELCIVIGFILLAMFLKEYGHWFWWTLDHLGIIVLVIPVIVWGFKKIFSLEGDKRG